MIRQVGSGFRGIHYPSSKAHQDAWERFQDLVEDVKATQHGSKSASKEVSTRHKNELFKVGESARPARGLIADMSDAAGNMIWSMIPGTEDVDSKQYELNKASERLKEAWALLTQYKEDMLGSDKQEVFEFLKGVEQELNSAWDAWRRARGITREAKREGRRERLRANIEKNKERLQKQLDALARRERHLEELEEQRDSAWSDSFIDRVNGWIAEEESRIESIKESIRQIEEWIEQGEEQL